MFEIDKGDSYEWTVTLGEPSNRTNKAETFTGRFRRLSQPRIDEINEAIRQRMIAATAGEPVEGMIDDMQLADEILTGWSGITSGGQPVEFSEGLKQELIARASFAAAIVEAWNESIIGGRKKTLRTPQGIS
jgi:hypothetical protein